MKKLFFILLMIPVVILAQDKNTLIGVKAGFVSSSIVEDIPGFDKKPKPGFLVGGFFDYNLTDNISLSTGLNYVTKGASFRATSMMYTDNNGQPIDFINYDVWLNYLELPVMVKASIGNKVKPYLSTGLAPAINVLAKYKYSINERKDKINLDRSFDIGYLINGGMQVDLNGKALLIEVRYNLGLVTAVENGFQNVKSSYFSINTGIGF